LWNKDYNLPRLSFKLGILSSRSVVVMEEEELMDIPLGLESTLSWPWHEPAGGVCVGLGEGGVVDAVMGVPMLVD
jgi:hypothetical protein